MRRTLSVSRSPPALLPQFLSWGFVAIITLVSISSQVRGEEKFGRCPTPSMDPRLCGVQENQCQTDLDCSGESKCCHTGCSQVCILPQFTACEQARVWTERRARALEPQDANSINLPICDDGGAFEEIQCDKQTGRCWCVNSQGYERPGTRARSLEFVNCTQPNKCASHQCRMLCPLGFELDEEGCPICSCRDPCSGVKCPGSLACELEEMPCLTEPCPPIPTCKQARTLESMCPIGVPLVLPESGKPYLCGKEAGKPQCPPAFECNIKDDNDYGVCCASNAGLEKPGTCPVIARVSPSQTEEESNCGREQSCRHDLDCPDFDKCCMSDRCGKRCVKPANSTLCLQQKKIAELLSVKEIEGKGYIPQCDDNGEFISRQCSRNGKVCWCVDPVGRSLPQSFGSAETVNCSFVHKQRVLTTSSLDACDNSICSNTCEFGYKYDRNGCPTCDCMENPCESFPCPAGSKCSLIQDPGCDGPSCTVKPTCLSESLYVNPCDVGTPLTDVSSGQVVTCSDVANTCPSSHICVVVSLNKAGLCCVNRPRVEPTKAGMCPFLSPTLCNGTMGLESKACTSDKDCEGDMKCCAVGGCGAVCADPLLNDASDVKLPTMCQYLKGIEDRVGGALDNFKLAINPPKCKNNGEFEEVQCDEKTCWCVDEFGAEIPVTRAEKDLSNLTSSYCLEKRRTPGCLGMNCRLGCDYGFETLDGCRICECRNPCKDTTLCSKDQQCEMIDVDCWDGHCPALPYCVPKALTVGKCPKGEAFLDPSTNETLTCNPRARMLQCPDDYFCHDLESSHDFGLCCPVLYDSETDQTLVAENRQSNVDDNILVGTNDETIVGSNDGRRAKLGQCPYLVPLGSGSCDFECTDDGDCNDDKKCCSNGCGTQCSQPIVATACQHQRHIIEHKARENGIPAQRMYIPHCRNDNGGFEPIQCHPLTRICWCVSEAGEEIPGTRSQPGMRPNCQMPKACPMRRCTIDCPLGYKLDEAGCPLCACKDPCEDTKCYGDNEECRLMQVRCLTEPCPPVPVCLPKVENPCSFGEPLTDLQTGKRLTCGPGVSDACPSTHRCSLSPFGDYAVCCPKPKEVCFEKKDAGHCKDTLTKWFFNTETNTCEEFTHSGCGGNLNAFDTKAECMSVCPTLTHCEKTREKNLEMQAKYKHLSYIPRCDPGNGEWQAVQCIDQVGMCWCVNRKGEPVKGTMTAGKPDCTFRQSRGRYFGAAGPQDSPVCEEGLTVHVCNKTLCDNKFCLAHPHASCRVDPCGGCKIAFYDSSNNPVNCEEGLGKCHRDLQRVVNSPASSNLMSVVIKDYPAEDESPALSSSSLSQNDLSELLQSVINSVERKDSNLPQAVTRTQVKPIYADVGGDKIVGVAASSVTVVGGRGVQVEGRPGHIDSIADILDGIMNMRKLVKTSSEEEEEEDDDKLSDLIDLMPSSSSIFGALSQLPFAEHVPVVELIIPEPVASRSQSRARSLRESFIDEVEEALPATSGISFSIVRPEKGGRCPPPKSFALLHILSGACQDTCLDDNQCEAHLKCCMGDCGFKCLEPISEPVAVIKPEPVPVTKPGVCPRPDELNLSCLDRKINEYKCESDGDCPSVEKCCFDGCSTSCRAPKVEDREPAMMVATAPQCLENGDYEPQQSQGDLMWCVDPEGNPLPHTLTRGRVMCNVNGSIIDRQIRGDVCPHSDKEPMICIDQCLTASCPAHPNAMCVADPCDDCKVTFYKQSGEKVSCEDKCNQPPESGLCRASFTRYFHNVTSGRCEEFIYGGCQGNDNNFETIQECEVECNKPVDVCSLPMKPGLCRASVERWYFNMETQSCEQFIYGGCGGNENNFASKEHCESRCPDLVLCPRIVDGEMKSCSRSDACQNYTCGYLDSSEFLCQVDPCTCTGVMKDLNGNDLDCSEFVEPATVPTTPSTTTTTEFEEPEEAVSETVAPVTEEEVEERTQQVLLAEQPEFESNMLKINMDVSNMKTRCRMISRQHSAQCNSQGQFSPMQCLQKESKSEPLCWCVDEAGNQLDGSKPFKRGTKSCKFVPVDKVDVVLNFPVSDDTSSVQMGIEMQDLLRKHRAVLQDNRVEVEVLPGSTNLRFALLGDNKVDVSYLLEELVKQNAIGVTEDKEFIPADLSLSRFHHVVSQSHKTEEEDIFINIIPDDGVVSAESLGVDNEYNTVFILLTIVAAITAVLFIVGLFLAFQKKKTTGSYPKKPFDSLAFSSQLYEYEKKMPLDLPTFKVTPYVQDYTSTDKKGPEKDGAEKA